MINLLIADDHKVLIDGFVSLFDKIENFQVVAVVNNGAEVLEKLKEVEVDIAILDINMPVLNGVETCKRIKKEFPSVKVIALSMYKESSFVKRMMQNGAKGYVLKSDSASTLIEAVNTVASGKDYYSDQLKDILINHIIQEKTLDINSITKREKQVLKLIAKGSTTKDMSELLFVSEHTIISHRKNLLSKFNAKNTAELVSMAMEKGLI